MARFIGVDPVLDSADLKDPQSWNRYSYVGNNPLRFFDPSGKQKQDATKRTKERTREVLRSISDEPAFQILAGVLLDAVFPDSNKELFLQAGQQVQLARASDSFLL